MAHKQYCQVVGHVTRPVPEYGHERATHAWVCGEIARLLGVRGAGNASDSKHVR